MIAGAPLLYQSLENKGPAGKLCKTVKLFQNYSDFIRFSFVLTKLLTGYEVCVKYISST